ncbi:hypothetical protein [Crocinitomix algicola]|uniref:hypothetical protein n=1 Tax=Crocinitomix algicola TaxID=1740263 RepID=UPI000871D1F1|nr:hypothetical protein [Crocinitomix algicola]
MKLHVSYKVVNNDYDQEYADQYNWGKPGPGNMKYHDTWKYGIDNVKSKNQIEKSELVIEGIDYADSKHQIIVPDVFQIKCELENGDIENYFVSNSLIRNIHTTQTKNIDRVYFYLNIKEGYVIIEDTNYIAKNQLPSDLETTEWKSLKLPHPVKSKPLEHSGSF